MKLALGTVQFGLDYGVANKTGLVSKSEASKILSLAKNHGIKTLDTAAAYGTSELVLGELNVDDWQIITKLPADAVGPDLDNWVAKSIGNSLKNLRQTNLYGVLLHRPSQLFDAEGELLYITLKKLKNEGFISKIGVSVYDPAELGPLLSYFDFDIVQCPFSVMDRRLISSGWMDRLATQGVELHIRSVFLQGLLLMDKRDRPSRFDKWVGLWRDWDNWLAETGLSATEACLGFALSKSEISKIVVGVQSESQLAEILTSVSRGEVDAPAHLEVDSQDLLNPARWASMQ